MDLSKSTQLKDRTLWFDGDSTFSVSSLLPFIQTGMNTEGMFVDQVTDEIKQFNKLVDPKHQIKIKGDVKEPNFDWNIPDEYKSLDIVDYFYKRFTEECQEMAEEEQDARFLRMMEEIALYAKLKLLDILRVIIYVINTLKDNNIVWGVGRGSSVSSYVLYLIGVHDVDSVKYGLDITDFLRAK